MSGEQEQMSMTRNELIDRLKAILQEASSSSVTDEANAKLAYELQVTANWWVQKVDHEAGGAIIGQGIVRQERI